MLTYDMVFVPELRFSGELLGLSATVPRAVPNDLVVAVVSRAIPAFVVQKLILAGSLIGAAVGAARLAPVRDPAARAAAGTFYAWNAFVYERLVMGHWTMLVWFAALPWVVRAAIDMRSGLRPARWRLAGALAISSFASSYGGVIATGTALVILVAPPWRPGEGRLRSVGVLAGAAAVLNLPWLVPSLLHPGGLSVRPDEIAAFASSSDSPLGTGGSLLALGGIWNGLVVPPGRSSPSWAAAFMALLAVAVAGWPLALRRWPRGAAWGLLAAACAGFLLAVSGSVPGLRDAYTFVGTNAPGGGILRDAQKFVAPLAVAQAVGFGLGVEWIRRAARSRSIRRFAAVLFVAAPVGIMPALAWGASGQLGTAHYPEDWDRARAAMASDPAPGAVLVLPWHAYLRFPWNGDRPVQNPATRYFTRRAVINTDLELLSGTIRGEDPWSEVARSLAEGDEPLGPGLPAIGVRYVVIEKAGEWRSTLPRTAGLDRVLDGPSLLLLRGGPAAPVEFASPPTPPVIAGHVAAGLFAAWPAAAAVLESRRKLLLSFGRPDRRGTDGVGS